MSWLPINTELGNLDLHEVYVDFDGPRVFSCISTTGQLYLTAWADTGDEYDKWLYVPVSTPRFQMIRSGALMLRDAFLRPEGPLYVAKLHHDISVDDAVEHQDSAELPDSWLPAEEFALSLPTPTAPPAASVDELRTLAHQEGRTRLDLSVHLPDYMRSEAPTKKVGLILLSMQNVLDNIGLAKRSEEVSQWGPIPAEIASMMSSSVVALSAASFVIGIASDDGPDLFGESLFAEAVEKLVKLLNVALPSELLIDELASLRPRGAKSFRRFVEDLSKTGGDIALSAGSIQFGGITTRLTAENLYNLSKLLGAVVPDEVREIRGRMRLFSADLDRKRFGLEDLMDQSVFEGKIADRAYSQVDHAAINDVYDVVITDVPSTDSAIGETKSVYTLEQLTRAANEAPIYAKVTQVISE